MTSDSTRIYASDYTGDDSIPVFVAFAIEQYAQHKGISGQEAMERLTDAGVLDHLAEFYDVMHQHGGIWLMEEIDSLIAKRDKGI